MLYNETIDLFKVIVLEDGQNRLTPDALYIAEATNGFVTDFVPSPAQHRALKLAFSPIPVTTLFSYEERKTLDPHALVAKQLLHYLEVYGLNQSGLFNLEVREGTTVVVAGVLGVTVLELGDMVRKLIYSNAPIRKIAELVEVIRAYDIEYDLRKVLNNEARIRLYREGDVFANGDDAVRYIVFKTTGDSLLIKSKKVIANVKASSIQIPLTFLLRHEAVLAAVFNRHKRIILSLKSGTGSSRNTTLNRISRLSKILHEPIRMAVNKTFIAGALRGEIKADAMVKVLRDNITLRDKFKFPNLIQWRLLQRTDDVFIIRNGRAHLENGRRVWSVEHLNKLQAVILASIEEDLAHLKGKRILLDPNVNYGLPISQKQMLGNLPFGTEVSVDGDTIVSGVYWHENGGASDIDLSTVDLSGTRTGWGGWGGYTNNNEIVFSGDVVSAPNGAMEFMASAKAYHMPYGLYANLYNGRDGSDAALVVGHQTTTKSGMKTRQGEDQKWIENPVIREAFKIESKEVSLGFVRDGKFVVYSLRTSNARVSGGEITKRLIAKALTPAWTVKRLLNEIGVEFDVAPVPGKAYDHALSYSTFSADKLEDMLFNRTTETKVRSKAA